jgi:DNA-binding response OmpR family regulator
MSELSGLEVCQMVKADPATMDTRVLLMSCHSSLADLSAGCAAGADDFVAKPFPRKELVHRVRLLLDAANRRPQTV